MKEEFIWKFSEYLSIHLRCESHAGSFVTCTRAKQEEPYLYSIQDVDGLEVLPACLDPHLSKWRLFIKHL